MKLCRAFKYSDRSFFSLAVASYLDPLLEREWRMLASFRGAFPRSKCQRRPTIVTPSHPPTLNWSHNAVQPRAPLMQSRLARHFNWKCTDSCAIAAAAVERRERTREEKEKGEGRDEETERWMEVTVYLECILFRSTHAGLRPLTF